eukprot:TRINITY_DN1424_c0_g1_i1.p1 TRINITY_DN1424_c0_g1~~TRINITY_DN1424_c0_g1_i1.p1  ORF type:complete len:709 (-),score=257.93 TRINITY_DN1424_c0_g1_i1:344-2470(-)
MADDFSESDEQVIAPLIQSSESVDGAIKAVFEDGREDECIKHLKSFIQRKVAAIDDKCTYNHQAFYASVEELITVQMDFRSLKDDIFGLNQKLQSTGNRMLTQADELVRKRLIRNNIKSAVETIGKCRQCMATAAKAYQQIKENSLYPALKTIRELERQLTAVAEYKVGIVLQQRIPVLVNSIIQKVFDGFCQWAEPEANLDKALALGEAHLQLAESRMKDSALCEDDDDNLPVADMREVSLCCHVMEALKCHEKFRECYLETRNAMLHNHLKVKNPRGRFLKRHEIQWEAYFSTVCGVFVVEDQILHAYAEQFTSKVDSLEMWDRVQSRILEELEYEIKLMTADQHLELAEHTAVFANAMGAIGFECDAVLGYVNASTGEFKDKLATQLADAFTRYPTRANLAPSRVQTESDYRKTEAGTMYSANPGTSRPPLPFEFAFSRPYVELCETSKQFFVQYGAMSQEDDDLFDEKEVLDCLRAFADVAIDSLQNSIGLTNMSVQTAMQVYIDMCYLQTKFVPKVEAVWLVEECGASADRAPTTMGPLVAGIQPLFLEHLVSVIDAAVAARIMPGQAQIDWRAREEDSKAALNPSEFVSAVAQYFSSEVFVNLNRLEADRSGLKASDVDRDRKEIESRVFSSMSDTIASLLDASDQVTMVALAAVLRDVQAIIEALHTHSKLRTLKLKECFAPITMLCKMCTIPVSCVLAAC